jgi:DNA replication protein DnaC
MRKGFNQGLSCQFMSHNQFSKLVMDAFSGEIKAEPRKRLDFLGKIHLLLIDDLGKAPSTERADAELEELIEVRGANMLPTFWTANGSGEWLIKRFGPDRGDALVRRLAEFSIVVKA